MRFFFKLVTFWSCKKMTKKMPKKLLENKPVTWANLPLFLGEFSVI